MQIYKWLQDMYRMFPSKLIELLKIAGFMYANLISSTIIKFLCLKAEIAPSSVYNIITLKIKFRPRHKK